MKKIFLFVVFSLLSGTYIHAQKMTDDQVVEYVASAQANGDNQQQISKELLRRGVTMEQINRIKRRMDSKEKAGIGQTLSEKDRMRTAPQHTSNAQLQGDKENFSKMKPSDREAMMSGGLEFLLSDSTMMYMSEYADEKEIFGHRIFQNKDLAFEAAYNLPTPPNYKLGPGDKVAIDIWGASQTSILETISPDGNIYVENLGPVHLSGLTVTQANNYLKRQFGQIYSGINGDEPNSNISLSLAQNRTIQIHVMGEVENPGTYTMSSFATIFNALYQSGGVNNIGTLREIKVYRGDKLVDTYDVYDFILNGKSNMGIRLEDNDVVVVDACKNLVNVTGAVKRPMYYEALDGETVGKILEYAGGLSDNAYKEDVRIERNGKYEREILTVTKVQIMQVEVTAGDVISVDEIAPTFSNMVEVRGAVYRPGKFQLSDNIATVKQLIEYAGGVKDEAFLNRVILNRRKLNGTMESLAIDLKKLLDGTIDDVPLMKNDVLLVHEWAEVYEMRTVTISGEVAFEGTYEYRENMTIEDAVLGAGGLKESASSVRVLVARRPKDTYATKEIENIAMLFELTLNDSLDVVNDSAFVLKPFDEIIVRKSPGYNVQEKVYVEGEVLFPGVYVLPSKHITLSKLIEMCGGCTSDAYLHSAKLLRKKSDREKELEEKAFEAALELALTKEDSLAIYKENKGEEEYSIAIDLVAAMQNSGSAADILLQEGDRLVIPRKIDVVRVSGEVMVPNAISYREGKPLKYYVNQAGGYTDDARKSKIYVVHANGEIEKVNRRSNSVYPGSEIVVSTKKKREGGMTAAQFVSLSSATTSLATVVLALMNVLK